MWACVARIVVAAMTPPSGPAGAPGMPISDDDANADANARNAFGAPTVLPITDDQGCHGSDQRERRLHPTQEPPAAHRG